MTYTTMAAAIAILSAALAQNGGPTSSCPMHAEHMRERAAGHSHLDEVNAHGDEAMGFSHAKTTHHFRLFPDGGAIDVSANDAADVESREEIRTHLRAIAKAFSEGRFDAPAAVHGRVPPGVPAMERHKTDIAYDYEQTESGARVRITTKNPDALDAVHDFLRFQIGDHQTGDSLEADGTAP